MSQERKNIRLLMALVGLLTLTATVYFLVNADERVLADPSLFKVPDLDKVDGIVMESQGRKIALRYDSNRWRVNEHFPADHQLVTVLFATLEQAIPKRPVAVGVLDSVNGILSKSGTTVSLYAGGNLVSTFQAGGNVEKQEAWFRHPDAKESYIMSIPGYRVYVSQIFELDENGWRDKRVFDFKWRNFIGLKSAFPGDPSGDFEVALIDKIFSVSGMQDADTSRVNAYLDGIMMLKADQFVEPGTYPQYDSLVRTRPINRIEVNDIAHRTFALNLYVPLRGEALILGLSRDRQMVLFDREKLFRVIKKRPWFKPRAQ